jgi:hypothetical protein
MDEDELLRRLTSVVRKADENFRKTRGSTRDWVRECFLPVLRDNNLTICEIGTEGD